MNAMWIREHLEKSGTTQAELAEAIGLTAVQINKILSGVRGIKATEADRMRQFFGYGEHSAPTRVENDHVPPPRSKLVSVYDIAASAGNGTLAEYESVAYSLAFPPNYLDKLTKSSPKHLAIISVKGDSMIPTLHDDDIVMVDMSKTNAAYDGMFVIRHIDVIKVKRLRISPTRETITIISDNDVLYPPETWPSEDVDVIGRVIWTGRKV